MPLHGQTSGSVLGAKEGELRSLNPMNDATRKHRSFNPMNEPIRILRSLREGVHSRAPFIGLIHFRSLPQLTYSRSLDSDIQLSRSLQEAPLQALGPFPFVISGAHEQK